MVGKAAWAGAPVTGPRTDWNQPQSRVSLFKVDPGGIYASRVQVQLGRSSVDAIEIVDGLAEGDRVILSDMSAWDGVDRIRLE